MPVYSGFGLRFYGLWCLMPLSTIFHPVYT